MWAFIPKGRSLRVRSLNSLLFNNSEIDESHCAIPPLLEDWVNAMRFAALLSPISFRNWKYKNAGTHTYEQLARMCVSSYFLAAVIAV